MEKQSQLDTWVQLESAIEMVHVWVQFPVHVDRLSKEHQKMNGGDE